MKIDEIMCKKIPKWLVMICMPIIAVVFVFMFYSYFTNQISGEIFATIVVAYGLLYYLLWLMYEFSVNHDRHSGPLTIFVFGYLAIIGIYIQEVWNTLMLLSVVSYLVLLPIYWISFKSDKWFMSQSSAKRLLIYAALPTIFWFYTFYEGIAEMVKLLRLRK